MLWNLHKEFENNPTELSPNEKKNEKGKRFSIFSPFKLNNSIYTFSTGSYKKLHYSIILTK